MSKRQPAGIRHLTVVPENAETGAETGVETDSDDDSAFLPSPTSG